MPHCHTHPVLRLAWILILLFTLLSLAACGKPTSIPTIAAVFSPTQTLTATATASVTPTPTVTPLPRIYHDPLIPPTPNPTLQPQAGPEGFRLNHLTEVELLRLYQEARVDDEIWKYTGDALFLEGSLLSEIFLRFPQRQEDEALQLQWAKLNAEMDGSFQYARMHDQTIEPFRLQMEKALNQGGVSLDTLEAWLKQRDATLLQPVLESETLFGDHLPAHVIQIQCGWIRWILAIRQKASGAFSVLTVHPRSFHSRYDLTLEILDLNGNGQEEIAITKDVSGPGMAGWHDRSLDVYEWDGKHFQNLMADSLTVEVWPETQLEELVITPDENGAQKITAGTFQETGCGDSFRYEMRFVYQWNGSAFKQTESSVLPLETGAPPECAIQWVRIAGAEDDRAVSLLRDLLEDWPEAIHQQIGPAAQDYYRLVYGLWLLQRGEDEEGLRQFKTVRDHPTAREYPWLKDLADAFLKDYTAGGLIRAVQTFQDGIKTKLRSIDTEASYLYQEDLLPAIGVYAGGEFALHPAVYLSQFSPELFLQRALQEEPIDDLQALTHWLARAGLDDRDPLQVDLNGDGVEDWLVEIGSTGDWLREDGERSLYAFLREGQDTLPVEIISYVKKGSSRTWHSYRPTPGADLVHLVQDENGLHVFRIVKQEDTWQAVNDLYFSSKSYSSYTNRPVDWHIEEYPAGKRLIVNYFKGQSIYLWDPEQQELIPTGYSPELKAENITQAETFIYIDRTPAKAIPILETVLSQNMWEIEHIYGEGNGNTPDIHPYVHYLLGLAYELSGDETNAVRAYWQLWQNYPEQAYTLVVRQKLEAVP